ncbi:Uma2 family endonuclease [Spirulina sp. 06S082]|uniref:Uma2 family endonuclease n=1 Tax=Spirulina sp. 06S082 TaxID=3110248 RepID=UPI003A4D8F64
MIASQDCLYISPEDYLAGERVSPIKHEYRDGEVYAMVGAKNSHVIIAGNIFALLRNHVRGSGCIAFISDTKVRIETTNSYYYPDVSISCDERDTRSLEDCIRFPVLIIEVLSPSTEGFDRGEKFADYRTLESLQEYVLIRQDRISVECYRRNSQGRWELYAYTEGQEIELASVNFSGAIASLYEDVPGILQN